MDGKRGRLPFRKFLGCVNEHMATFTLDDDGDFPMGEIENDRRADVSSPHTSMTTIIHCVTKIFARKSLKWLFYRSLKVYTGLLI